MSVSMHTVVKSALISFVNGKCIRIMLCSPIFAKFLILVHFSETHSTSEIRAALMLV